MNYSQARKYIEDINTGGMVFGLESVKTLLDLVGNPQKKLNIVHIAGTNGKGSVGEFLSSILAMAGYRVGRFYSPALFEYEETFCIQHGADVSVITKDEVAYYITTLREKCNEVTQRGVRHPSAFEIETAMAMMFLADKNTDIAIVECGLGGESDATNCVDNIMEVITSISLDHTRILGDTLEQIAREKCGIIRPGSIVVTPGQKDDVINVISEECKRAGAKLIIADTKHCQVIKDDLHGITYNDNYNDISNLSLAMTGEYQIENAHISVCAAMELKNIGYNITKDDIKRGLLMAKWRGRFDIVNGQPLVVADGAHNENAATMLHNSIEKYLHGYKKIYIAGIFKDKDYDKILHAMSDKDALIYAGTSNCVRSLSVKELAKAAKDYYKEVIEAKSINDALVSALKVASQSQDKTAIICFGSLSIMKEIYDYFSSNQNGKDDIVSSILHNAIFNEKLNAIREYEKKRVFCGHDIDHLLDVARIAWILCLEENVHIDKDIVYAACLLHDIGRADQYMYGVNHETAGASLARDILRSTGATESDIEMIIDAISYHSDKTGETRLDVLPGILKKADSLSRRCFACKAYNFCKWPSDRKNNDIIY